MAYCLRERKIGSYKQLCDGPWLPRYRRQIVDTERIYPVEVLEKDKENHRVRVHYLGYSEKCDEWVKEEDTVDLEPQGA